MTFIQTTLSRSLVAVAALGCCTAWADPSGSCGPLTRVHRNIVAHADEGMESLRGYVYQTDVIYGVSMREVRDHLDAWRAVAHCERDAAAAHAAAEMAANARGPQDAVVALGR